MTWTYFTIFRGNGSCPRFFLLFWGKRQNKSCPKTEKKLSDNLIQYSTILRVYTSSLFTLKYSQFVVVFWSLIWGVRIAPVCRIVVQILQVLVVVLLHLGRLLVQESIVLFAVQRPVVSQRILLASHKRFIANSAPEAVLVENAGFGTHHEILSSEGSSTPLTFVDVQAEQRGGGRVTIILCINLLVNNTLFEVWKWRENKKNVCSCYFFSGNGSTRALLINCCTVALKAREYVTTFISKSKHWSKSDDR